MTELTEVLQLTTSAAATEGIGGSKGKGIALLMTPFVFQSSGNGVAVLRMAKMTMFGWNSRQIGTICLLRHFLTSFNTQTDRLASF